MAVRKIIAVIAALCAATCAWASSPAYVGHRGSDKGVESSVEALVTGAARGYEYLESDVRVASDGTFVLSHDETTARLGSGLEVASTPAAALVADSLAQTRWGNRYTGHMATLADMLDICARYGSRPLIELKWATGINSKDTSGIPALIDFVTDRGMRDRCIILTSMKPCLEFIRANYPDVACQLLVHDKVGDENYEWCVKHGTGIDVRADGLTAAIVDRFHAAGLPVNVWCVNTQADLERFSAMGVDFITTDSLLKPSDTHADGK